MVVTLAIGDARRPGLGPQPPHGGAQPRQGLGRMAAAKGTAVFAEGHVADPVEPVFEGPVAAAQGLELARRELVGGQAGETVRHGGALRAVRTGPGRAPADGQTVPGHFSSPLTSSVAATARCSRRPCGEPGEQRTAGFDAAAT